MLKFIARLFGSKPEAPTAPSPYKVEPTKCGCGRSPTGYCIGWHNLDENTFQHMKQQWIEEQFRKDAENESESN